MITEDEIKLCIKELKNNPEKAQEFLKSIRITSEKHKYPSRFAIYNEKKKCHAHNDVMERKLETYILDLCKKCNGYLSYSKFEKGERVFYDSGYTEESIRNTLSDWLDLFYFSASIAFSLELYICKSDIVQYTIYGRNDYSYNYEKFLEIIREYRNVDVVGKNKLYDYCIYCGLSKEDFCKQIDRIVTDDILLQAFIKMLKREYPGACCYPHEVKKYSASII